MSADSLQPHPHGVDHLQPNYNPARLPFEAPSDLRVFKWACVPIVGFLFSLKNQRRIIETIEAIKIPGNQVRIYEYIEKINAIKLMSALGSTVQSIALIALLIFTSSSFPLAPIGGFILGFNFGAVTIEILTYLINKLSYTAPHDIDSHYNQVC